jgi:hypothetical protein
MNFLVKKVVTFLLKRTEHLKNVDMRALDSSNPKERRMKGMLEKRAMLVKAVGGESESKNSPNQRGRRTGPDATRFSSTIADSLAAKKSATAQSKRSSKNNPRKANRTAK